MEGNAFIFSHWVVVPERTASPVLGNHRVSCFGLEAITFVCETLETIVGPNISNGGEYKISERRDFKVN